MPDTDSDSSVIADISASEDWVSVATARRVRPTRSCSAMNTGSNASDTTVSCHDSTTMVTSAPATTTMLDNTVDAVSVTTVCTPLTSLPRRDWIWPVRVAVKNARSIACRCANSRSRRSCITRLPRRLAMKVCHTPSAADVTVTAAMPPTSRPSSRSRGPPSTNSARSNTARVNSGLTTSARPVTTISAPTSETCRR